MTKEVKREAKIAARVPMELKKKLTELNKTKENKYMTESDIICLALEEYVEKYGKSKTGVNK
jgi:hypothetical protein